MRMLRFSKLYLLSQREQRALKVSFGAKPVVVRARNGYGKSAVIKSLYDAFGAEPHKIDRSWRAAEVTTVVEFSVDGRPYSIMKALGTYSVFDADHNLLLRTSHVTKELAPFLADLLDFRLVMTDRKEQTVVPPPAYIFAPFYIDQDKGWSEPWSSFGNMYLPNSKATLADYHSGLRPNAFYIAQAERDRLRIELGEVQKRREALAQTLQRISHIAGDVPLNYDLADFQQESERLLIESKRLHKEQSRYRATLSELNEEHRLWNEQVELLTASLAEIDEALVTATQLPSEVECPTCGQSYDNSLVERFGLVGNYDGLLSALLTSQRKISLVNENIAKERQNLSEMSASIANVEKLLLGQKSDLTFRDVVVAEGRNEASKLIKHDISANDTEAGEKQRLIQGQQKLMDESVSRDRTSSIRGYFLDRLTSFCIKLDVRLGHLPGKRLSSVSVARGSEGPRGLIAYCYAFLSTEREYGSSAFCPIVIDAPNQQGQDDIHMPQIMNFIADERPIDSQLIIAAEELYGLPDQSIDVVDVGRSKNSVLQEDQYSEVSASVRPLLGQLI